MSYVFKKEVIDMTYKQNENSKTSLNNFLEKIILQNKKPLSLKLHDLEIDHETVNMTEQYIKKILLNGSRAEAYQSFFLSSSSQFIPMSASQFRHEHAYLYFSEMLNNKQK